jgi:hypothetical protein
MSKKRQQLFEKKQKAVQTPGQPKFALNAKLFFEKYRRVMFVSFVIVFCLFCFSVFKNIRYPLFWADESITAVGGQRVLQYGYPKVHDGKNVFYDLRHPNIKLGIDEKTDAYIGGSAWLHYYIAALAIKIASFSSDPYIQTGIMRSIFALTGIAGILLFLLMISRFLDNHFSKFLLSFLFFGLCLFSISLTLLLREVRYYSPNILLVCFTAGYYVVARFLTVKKYLYLTFSSLALLLLFHTFSPAYFILILSLLISESVIVFFDWMNTDDLKSSLLKCVPFVIPVIISMTGVAFSLPYFKTFSIAKEMAIYNAANSGGFAENVQSVLSYFWKFELLWLAIPVKIFVLLKSGVLIKKQDPRFKASLFFSLLFLVYCISITRIPNFIFTRYFSPAILVLNATILLDLFCLNQFYQPKTLPAVQLKILVLSSFGIILFVAFGIQNHNEISGHLRELSEPYKGPLDYIIPYLKEKYKQTDNLTIATNYEESSYMYYLNSKTIVGYVGNNLKEDTLLVPDVVSIRKTWSFNREPVDQFLRKAHYSRVSFPVHDNPVNNMPELNFLEEFNHLYETQYSLSEEDATDLYIKTGK